MMRSLLRALAQLSCAGATATLVAVAVFGWQRMTAGERAAAEARAQRDALRLTLDRLAIERRVAEVFCVAARKGDDGKPVHDLLWVELDQDGTALAPRPFTVRGERVYVDGQLVRFDRGYLEDGDLLRGRSVALFTGLFGSAERPDDAHALDSRGKLPAYYAPDDERAAKFARGLFADFWKLASDEALRAEHGVALAYGEAVSFKPQVGWKYEVTLKPDAGLAVSGSPVPEPLRSTLARSPG